LLKLSGKIMGILYQTIPMPAKVNLPEIGVALIRKVVG